MPTGTNKPETTPGATQAVSTEKKLLLKEVTIFSNAMYTKALLNGADLFSYAGKATLTFCLDGLSMDTPVSNGDIIGFIRVNGEKLNENDINCAGPFLQLSLSDSMPEDIYVELLPGLTIDGKRLETGFSQQLRHLETVKCTINLFSVQKQSELPHALFLAGSNQTFKIDFSKPMDRASVSIIAPHMESEWLNDQALLVHLSGLSPNNSYRISIEKGRSAGSSLENDIDIISSEDNSPEYQFQSCKPQHLRAINLRSLETRNIKMFDQGMLAEELSPDHGKLSMGIITNDEDGYFYTKCILDLRGEPQDLLITPFRDLYNPSRRESNWTNKGEYEGEIEAKLLSEKTELTRELWQYTENMPNRWMGDIFKLSDGKIAVIQTNGRHYTEEKMYLVITNMEGEVLKEYPLPFITKSSDGWIQYVCGIEEIENSILLLTGFEKPPYGPVSSYLLDLENGEMTLVIQSGELIKQFPEFEFGLYHKMNASQLTDYQTTDIIDFSGKILKTIEGNGETNYRYPFYNPEDGKIYIFSNLNQNNMSRNLHWVSVNPETLETNFGEVKLERYGEPVGFLNSGELLMLDNLSFPD
jgi:hypothetical protein